MPTAKLTKTKVESEPPSERDVIIWDTDVKGFGCKITPAGKRTYFVKVRVGGGRSGRVRKPTIGPHGVFTVDQARQVAMDMVTQAMKGLDPMADRDASRNAPSVADFADRYLREHATVHKKPTSVEQDRKKIENHILPAFGSKKVADVSRVDVTDLHHKLRNTPYEANRTLALLSKMFGLAEAWGLRDDNSNPCRHCRKYREVKRSRYYTGPELKAFGEALRAAESASSALPGVIATVRLLALTGCRASEILAVRWSDVDLEKQTLKLRDAKAGPRDVYLGTAACTVLASLDRESEYVVHGRDPQEPLSLSSLETAWRRLRVDARIPDGRLHDFRHTVGTYGGQAGFNAFLVRDLLGHKTLAMTGRYVEADEDPVRQAADLVANRVAAAMDGSEAEVIPLNSKG